MRASHNNCVNGIVFITLLELRWRQRTLGMLKNPKIEIKKMEKKRNALRQNLYHAQDEVDSKKENLISEIEARLKQNIETTELFLVKWTVV